MRIPFACYCAAPTLAILALLAGCATSSGPSTTLASRPLTKIEKVGAQAPFEFSRVVRREEKLSYLLYLPKEYMGDPAKPWPLVVFLHGSGERGTNLAAVSVHGPPRLVREGRDFPFILVSPQCPSGSIWDDDTVLGLIDDISAHYRVDSHRIYLTGLSMGGFGTWSLASRHPERFAAVAPICGGGERLRTLLQSDAQKAAMKTLGVWAFHGGKDPVVKLEESQRMIDAFKQAGCSDIQLTIYPDAGHDSWTQAYNDQHLYDWLLKHSR